jgi:hypothetical protein
MRAAKKDEGPDISTKYLELSNQYARLADIRDEKINDLIDLISGLKRDSLSHGEVLSHIYNITEVDGHIRNTLDTVNKFVNGKSKYRLDPLIRDAMAVGILKKESEVKKKRVELVTFGGRKGLETVVGSYDGVKIIQNPDETVFSYNVLLPDLKAGDWRKIKELKEIIIKESKFDPTSEKDMDKKKREFANEVRKILNGADVAIPQNKLGIYIDILTKSMIGYGFLDPLLADDHLEEIMVLGEQKNVYVYHREFGMCSTNVVFADDDEIVNIISRMAREVGRKIDILNPLLDARTKDGSRINATIRPITPGEAGSFNCDRSYK